MLNLLRREFNLDQLIDDTGDTHLYQGYGEVYKVLYNKKYTQLNIKSDLSGKDALGVHKIGKFFRIIWKDNNQFFFSQYDLNGNEVKQIKKIGPVVLKKQEKIFGRNFTNKA
tara:strand:- start:520 stop:855 length:336 start_codon:yes stop_codon:yes gene_type:complete